jgi:hypothetical protein
MSTSATYQVGVELLLDGGIMQALAAAMIGVGGGSAERVRAIRRH